VPLHPSVVGAISEVLAYDFGENDDAKLFFMFNSFQNWIERQKIPLKRVRDPSKARMWLSDFRKFAEQCGDIIGWDATNRKYVLAHWMTGVDWEHHKHPLPGDVYDTYMLFICNIGEPYSSICDDFSSWAKRSQSGMENGTRPISPEGFVHVCDHPRAGLASTTLSAVRRRVEKNRNLLLALVVKLLLWIWGEQYGI
jgi:hypothetical protein